MDGRFALSVIATIALFCAQPPGVAAHHGYALFDDTQVRTFDGTLAKIEWHNPHVFVWGYQKNATGGHDLYAFEADAVNRLQALGWSPDVVKAGEKVVVRYNPLRDGRTGGKLLALTLSDGTVLKTTTPFVPESAQ